MNCETAQWIAAVGGQAIKVFRDIRLQLSKVADRVDDARLIDGCMSHINLHSDVDRSGIHEIN